MIKLPTIKLFEIQSLTLRTSPVTQQQRTPHDVRADGPCGTVSPPVGQPAARLPQAIATDPHAVAQALSIGESVTSPTNPRAKTIGSATASCCFPEC